MTEPFHEKDPGWVDPENPWLILVPYVQSYRERRHDAPPQNPLREFRQLYLAFPLAILLFGLVLPFLGPFSSSSVPLEAVVGGLAVVALACVVVSRLVGALDCTDDRALRASYRNRFFIRIAICEAGALAAFVTVFLVGRPWLYLVGAVPTLVGFLLAAPSKRNIERDQEELTASGCDMSLLAALQQPPGPGASARE